MKINIVLNNGTELVTDVDESIYKTTENFLLGEGWIVSEDLMLKPRDILYIEKRDEIVEDHNHIKKFVEIIKKREEKIKNDKELMDLDKLIKEKEQELEDKLKKLD